MTDLGVVMPVYIQKPAFLQEAIASILSQSWKRFRFIIVIDGAPSMEPLVRAWTAGDERVEIMAYPENQGVAKALNTGFRELLADEAIQYVTWVSSDNVYRPLFLETLRHQLANGPEEVGLVYSSFQSIDNDGLPMYTEHQLAMQRAYQAAPKEKLLDSSIIGVSFMYKSRAAKHIEGYYLEPVEDYDYWLRLTEHCDICYVPVEMMDYRVDSAFSISKSLKSVEKHRKWRYAYHLARHQARTRRGIELEVTLLLTVREADEAAIARLENLYDQTFSNYVCFVLDLSSDQQAATRLSGISHPLTRFSGLPEQDEVTSILRCVPFVKTPYVMVVGPERFQDPSDLQVLVNNMRVESGRVLSCYMEPEAGQSVSYRYAGMPSGKPDIYNELFHTVQLVELLKPFYTSLTEPPGFMV